MLLSLSLSLCLITINKLYRCGDAYFDDGRTYEDGGEQKALSDIFVVRQFVKCNQPVDSMYYQKSGRSTLFPLRCATCSEDRRSEMVSVRDTSVWGGLGGRNLLPFCRICRLEPWWGRDYFTENLASRASARWQWAVAVVAHARLPPPF